MVAIIPVESHADYQEMSTMALAGMDIVSDAYRLEVREIDPDDEEDDDLLYGFHETHLGPPDPSLPSFGARDFIRPFRAVALVR